MSESERLREVLVVFGVRIVCAVELEVGVDAREVMLPCPRV